jgi:hypothetical protein
VKVTVVSNLDDAAKVLRKRGLEPGGRVQQLFTNEVAKQSDPYVPMQQGILKNTRIIGPDSITYNTPYARNMYYGKVMVDPVTGAAGFLTKDGWRSRKGVKKIVSDREYNYHGAPMRGKFWDKRMWADKKRVIVNNVAAAAGGKAE